MSILEELGLSLSAGWAAKLFTESQDPLPYFLVMATDGVGGYVSKPIVAREPVNPIVAMTSFIGEDIAKGRCRGYMQRLRELHPGFHYSGVGIASIAGTIDIPNTVQGRAFGDQQVAAYQDGKPSLLRHAKALFWVGPDSAPMVFVEDPEGGLAASDHFENMQHELKLLEEINRRFVEVSR